MKLLPVVTAVCIALGAAYATSIALDAAYLVKERFRGPYLEMGVPSVPSQSATDIARLQQACGDGADPPCPPSNQDGVVWQGGLGLKGNLSLGSRGGR